jgi:hypothetical protein
MKLNKLGGGTNGSIGLDGPPNAEKASAGKENLSPSTTNGFTEGSGF